LEKRGRGKFVTFVHVSKLPVGKITSYINHHGKGALEFKKEGNMADTIIINRWYQISETHLFLFPH
jgi:hypothetical protein